MIMSRTNAFRGKNESVENERFRQMQRRGKHVSNKMLERFNACQRGG